MGNAAMCDIFDELRKTRKWFDNLTSKKLKDIELIKKRIDIFYRDWKDAGIVQPTKEVKK
jgi:hypothetical protein